LRRTLVLDKVLQQSKIINMIVAKLHLQLISSSL